MALRDDFEGLRGTILHRSPLPSVDSVVHELLAEEIRLKSQVDKKTIASSTPSVFATPQRSMPHNQSKQHQQQRSQSPPLQHQNASWKSSNQPQSDSSSLFLESSGVRNSLRPPLVKCLELGDARGQEAKLP
ncbi:hypothetical protein ZIOFF_065896 [Zingiber officinale]|uniref:Uncharacterized protein n=1 Tax=Zingiber officinale TaxID=94328 RepID=A0A8J5EXM8_ZINOF|nr:hypothetical protein ZIOFF_065896 [Zingiber officinale]